jgi:3-deoxy-D-manno-octulosonic-acid transferase
MSLRSFRRWRLAPQSASELLGRFVLCLAQDNDSAERLTALGARNTRAPGNLKHDAHPLPANAGSLSEMRHMLQGRPYWLCASTHPGEEDVLLATHEILAQGDPRLLTILAPRHPERGSDIALRARARGLGCVRRSFAEKIGDETSLYIADTLGELGLFYRLCDIVFMGGSLIAHGGQNPLEAARLSCALLTGPHTQNFHDIYAALEKQGGLIRVSDAAALSAAVEGLLEDPQARQRSAQTALDYAKSVSGVLARVISAMEPYLPPLMDRSDARP